MKNDLMTGPSTPNPQAQRGISRAVKIPLMSGRMTSPRTDGEQLRNTRLEYIVIVPNKQRMILHNSRTARYGRYTYERSQHNADGH